MANIQNFNAMPGSQFIDNSDSHIAVALPGSTVQQIITPEDQPQPQGAASPSEATPHKPAPVGKSAIRLREYKGNKVNFIRVIKALHLEGYFESENGGRPTEEEVFAAFGIAINESLADATAQLSNNRKNNLPSTRAEVFTTLHTAYQQYEQSIDAKKKERE